MKELGSILESHDWLRRKLTFWGSAVSDYCYFVTIHHLESFTVLTKENRKFALELKVSLKWETNF